MVIKQFANKMASMHEMITRPACELKISSKCTGKALMVIMDDEGNPHRVCHFCRWKAMYNVEYAPKQANASHKVSRIPTQNDNKVAEPMPQDGSEINPETRYDS